MVSSIRIMKAALALSSLVSKVFGNPIPKSTAMQTGTIVVNETDNISLFYQDSGVPPAFNSSYTTIFAIHGLSFAGGIWSKAAEVGRTKGLRFVMLNRRGYNGSTPFSEQDIQICTNGTDDQKTQFVKDRGLEILTFITKFNQQNPIPQIPPTGKGGGFAILGWSAGAAFATAAIANVDALPTADQALFTNNLRAHIAQEPASISYGQTPPPKTWSPQIDTSVPVSAQIPMFKVWITSFFNHGDLSTRDPNVLEYFVPAFNRTPVMYNMTQADQDAIIDPSNEDTFETPFVLNSLPQLSAVYMKAYFDKGTKALLPHLKTTYVTGDTTASFGIAAMWATQDDNTKKGGDAHFIVVPGANHFLHWIDPQTAVNVYLQAL